MSNTMYLDNTRVNNSSSPVFQLVLIMSIFSQCLNISNQNHNGSLQVYKQSDILSILKIYQIYVLNI